MRDIYMEQDYPRYFVHGEHADGRVDVVTLEAGPVATVTPAEAAVMLAQRDAVIDRLCAMARAFEAAAPEEFVKFWYPFT